MIHSAILNGIRDFGALEWRMFLRDYYRYVEKVDQEIGWVLSALERSRLRDNTLIIFSVDHGEAAGRHRMFQKFTLYEESVRVPFIVASFGERFGISKGSFDRVHLVSGVDPARSLVVGRGKADHWFWLPLVLEPWRVARKNDHWVRRLRVAQDNIGP